MHNIAKKMVFFIIRIRKTLSGNHLRLEKGVRVKSNASLEGYNRLCKNSYLSGSLGFGSYIGENSVVIGKVGRFCSIASNVIFLTKTHPISGFVSTHPIFYSLKKQCGITFASEQLFDEEPKLDESKFSIIVGNDVYIGYGATIIGPAIIGDGAVIAANATVIGDVAPYTVVGGIPAKIIKQRFSEDDIKWLMQLQWWNRDVKWIEEHSDSFMSIKALKLTVNKESSGTS